MITLVFTCGDINGIGPEICIKTMNAIHNPAERKIVLFCPANVFEIAASKTVVSFDHELVKETNLKSNEPDKVTIVDLGNIKQNIGKPTKQSGIISYEAIKRAFKLVHLQNADALITAPISKNAFRLAGIKYPGHTELLADLSITKDYLMMFLSDDFICGLATIHEPIKNVSKLLTKTLVRKSIKILKKSLEQDLGANNPKIAVLGLNPHAGERGEIGCEEIESIKPAIYSFKNKMIEGPFVPDAFFANKMYQSYSAVLGMYHDQVLIPFKMMNFNRGVNYSAGLPIIRTSPDHGTAFDIAGRGIADSSSMEEAVRWAERIIYHRRRFINAR